MSQHRSGTRCPSAASSLTSRHEEFETLLSRHGVALSRIRGSRGLVRCILPGHDDSSPSLSLDLAKCLFYCFGCGRGGGLKALRELLGETPVAPARPSRAESDIQMARREAMHREQRAGERRAEWAPWQYLNGHIRRCAVTAARARAIATQLGPDDPRTWPLLEQGAAVEREGFILEAELNELAIGRLT